mmetsp:Transcript_14382/g.36045  ORF Transcript_14382/g.36045 Transcript_14382/m.36045 type:complete len:265 (-) Transcript_14382:345-1139(-)
MAPRGRNKMGVFVAVVGYALTLGRREFVERLRLLMSPSSSMPLIMPGTSLTIGRRGVFITAGVRGSLSITFAGCAAASRCVLSLSGALLGSFVIGFGSQLVVRRSCVRDEGGLLPLILLLLSVSTAASSSSSASILFPTSDVANFGSSSGCGGVVCRFLILIDDDSFISLANRSSMRRRRLSISLSRFSCTSTSRASAASLVETSLLELNSEISSMEFLHCASAALCLSSSSLSSVIIPASNFPGVLHGEKNSSSAGSSIAFFF